MTKIVIVGGGVSGLSAGIYARKEGYDVTVLEKHAVAGGNLTGWQRNGFTIDNCIHWLTGTNPASSLYGTWKELGILPEREKLVYREELFTCFYRGERFGLPRDLSEFAKRMLARSPRDEKEIFRLISAIGIVQGLSGIAGEGGNEKLSPKDVLLTPLLLRYFAMTTGDLSRRFHDPLLQKFFSSVLTDSFGALGLIAVFAHFCGKNADVPAGGSLCAARRMADRFISLGGELRLSSEVVRIDVKEEKARSLLLKNGERISFDYLLVSTDPAVAFPVLIGMPLPKKLAALYSDRRMRRFSSVQCAFACKTKNLPFRGEAVLPSDETENMPLLVREFSFEKDFAPQGYTVMQTMVFCLEMQAERWISLRRSPDAYREEKEKLVLRTTERIEKSFPSLKGSLEFLDCWTPATYRRYVGSEIGSYMGFAFSSGRIPKKLSPEIKSIKNCFLCGQWLRSPGGLPIAAESGKRAVAEVKKNLTKRRSRIPAALRAFLFKRRARQE